MHKGVAHPAARSVLLSSGRVHAVAKGGEVHTRCSLQPAANASSTTLPAQCYHASCTPSAQWLCFKPLPCPSPKTPQVVPLDYIEWFCCIAAGFGTCLVSWATRWMSRNMRVDMVEVIINLRGGGHHTNRRSTGRSLSGRQYSGRTYTGRPDDYGSHRGNRGMKGSSMRGSASIKVVSLRGNSVHGSSARSNNKVLPT